ncbi:MAG: ZIP family metal transporter, partial [Clostridia bacterium]|nr:ZIP family metal transporter [Clostridia bacterium]
FIIAVVIGLHNIPEGMSVSVPLISGGMKKWKAIAITALSGAPTIIGAMLGYSLGLISPIWLSLSLSFAGGAMLYVVFGELLPEAFLMWKSKAPGAFALIGTLVGVILVHV